MATSVFKGAIGNGSITARYLADSSNADSDVLVMSYAESGGGNPVVDRAPAVPGGFANVGVSAPSQGVLEVWVSTGNASDGGTLSVACNGTLMDQEAITGSTRWVYAVEAG